MNSKLDAFYAAKEMLMMEADRKNDAIRHKFDLELSIRMSDWQRTPAIPEFEKGPTVEEIIELAKKIHEYIEPSPNKPGATKLLTE